MYMRHEALSIIKYKLLKCIIGIKLRLVVLQLNQQGKPAEGGSMQVDGD